MMAVRQDRLRWGKLGFASLLLASPVACSSRIVISEPQSARSVQSDAEPGGLVYSLPETWVIVAAAQDTKGAVSYTVTAKIVPDPTARYRLRYTSSGTTDDDLDLKIDTNGLLTSGSAAVTDETGQIVVTLAKLVATSAHPLPLARALPPVPAAPVYPFTVVFDLPSFARGVELPDRARIAVTAPADIAAGTSAAPCSASLCYRTLVPIRSRITAPSPSAAYSDFVFLAVDPTRTEGIDLRSAALVKRTNDVTFANGIATETKVSQPSTALAVAKLPLDVVSAIISAPADLLTLRIKNEDSQATLIEKQAAVLQQQTALANAQKSLLDAQQALAKDKVAAAASAAATP